jgi:hypothetical protein
MCGRSVRLIGQLMLQRTDFLPKLSRHDSDSNHPRSRKEIYKLNQQVADLMDKTFGFNASGDPDQIYVPIVPSFGKFKLISKEFFFFACGFSGFSDTIFTFGIPARFFFQQPCR